MKLAPTDVLVRDPRAQAIALPDGRLLVRHADGASLLGGVSREDLERVLAQVDGTRTAAEVVAACAALHPPLSEREARGLLVALDGEMLRRVVPRGEGAGSDAEALSIVVFGSGALARRIERELRREEPGASFRRLGRRGLSGAALSGTKIVVCAIEDAPYRDLLAVQSACLATETPALFVTADPDGVRIGPTAVPGVGPCFGCAQLTALRFVRLDPSATLAASAALRAGIVDPQSREQVVSAIVAEVRQILRPGGEPGLTRSLLLLPPLHSGGAQAEGRHLPLERDPACPLCSTVPPPRTGIAVRSAISIIEAEERRPQRATVPLREEPNAFVQSVGILGGGTAGYLAALALRRKAPGLAVTLIESPDIPVIGVGEATTPLLPQFLHADLGLDVHTLFAEVRPTFKLGIRFLWGAPGDGDFNYPFGPLHLLEPSVYGEPGRADLRACSLQSLLMDADAVGLYRTGDGEAAERASWTSRLGTATAYHLDNERFVSYLKRRAAEVGIERLEATLVDAEVTDDRAGGREVSGLVCADGRRLAFDLYVDCSGFRSFLLERALGSPWRSFESSLWTDRAVVADVPHGNRLRPYTTAETMAAGWCWNIPQIDSNHRGYVYSSAHLSPEKAEAEMRRANPGMGEAREVRFRSGRHEHFWRGNVVALGNAYGFVEPLESTALHLLIRQIGQLCGTFPLRRADHGLAPLLNRRVGAWWDYLRWFLALHYRFNRRLDTPFWQAARAEVDVSHHAELLEAFRHRGPLSYDPAVRSSFDYPDPLWGPEGIDTLLLGQGVPCRLPRPHLSAEAWRARVARMRSVVARAESHSTALGLLAARPDLRERFAAAFRAAGPAFPAG
ncbi:MAG TPA: tryptophan 7-halogenase [Thermoanaerobaculia bacterium]|jgi:tryptophan halogenase|nr:tryptophan 7-halogenase [Thermoanaerobaculia bacterium]